MGSLSDLKTLVSKEYMPGQRTSTAAGLGTLAVGGTLLASSRDLTGRTAAAWRRTSGVYGATKQQAAARPSKRNLQLADMAARDKAVADRLMASARGRQQMLRGKGRAALVAGAGLTGYGLLAGVNNRRQGLS